jgi:hypothetical protein
MANPHKLEGDGNRDPLVRPPSAGEGADSAEARQRSRRERYPGWDTIHGKPRDPRFEGTTDPNEDARFDTHLNSASVLPRKLNASLVIWFLAVGMLLALLLGFAMYWHFRWSSPRTPPQTSQAVYGSGRLLLVDVGPGVRDCKDNFVVAGLIEVR